MKENTDSAYDSVAYYLVKTTLSESGRVINQSRFLSRIVIGWFFRFCSQLRQTSFHWIISNGVVIEIGRKRSDSDSDSVELVTRSGHRFLYVVSARTLSAPTPTPSLVQTSL